MNSTRVGAKQFRKHMKTYIEGTEAIAIGDHYQLRAIVVPVPHAGYDDAAKRRFAAIIAREHPRSGSLLRG